MWVPPRSTPDEWAAVNRVYPRSSALPGPRDPTLTPYVIPVARAIADGRARRVVIVMGAQSGKTEMLLDVAGQRLDQRPTPVIYVGPNKQFLTEQFEPRVMALLDEAPTLAAKLARGKRMTKTRKVIAGVPFRLAHAGSSAALKSDPAGLALVDEYDELLANVKGQGDPLGLVERRGDTYPDFVAAVTSTCSRGVVESYTDEQSGLVFWRPAEVEDIIQSPVWALWQRGTMYHWSWPCPSCGDFFIPRSACLEYPKDASPVEAGEATVLACPRCGSTIEDSESKADMNRQGVFIAPGQRVEHGVVIGEPSAKTDTLSYWVSGLASPFVSWGARVKSYVDALAMRDTALAQTAVNAGFGELYAPSTGDAPLWSEVIEHASEYARGEVPAGVLRLIMTVDVQKSCLFFVIRGWGARATSWLIDWGVLYGPTVEQEVWTDLAELMKTPVGGKSLRLVLIDSGFRPGKKTELPLHRVYDFGRRFPRIVRCTRGSSHPMNVPLIKSRIDVRRDGSKSKYGLELLRLDTDHWKSWVHERIRWPIDQPGAWYLPHDVDVDYAKQMVSEAREVLPSGHVDWVQRAKDNHYFDAEAMSAAGGYLLNMQRVGAKPQTLNNEPSPPAPTTGARIVQQQVSQPQPRRGIAHMLPGFGGGQ